MNDITIRFLDAYDYLKNTKKVSNPKGFAMEIGVSTSLITEICKKRTNAGLTPIQNLITRFEEISSDWLLTGNGSMIKGVEKEDDSPDNFKELAEARKETSELLKGKVMSLEKEVLDLKSRLKDKEDINALLRDKLGRESSVQRGAVTDPNRLKGSKLGEEIGK
jgi:hypothetical protein